MISIEIIILDFFFKQIVKKTSVNIESVIRGSNYRLFVACYNVFF